MGKLNLHTQYLTHNNMANVLLHPVYNDFDRNK
jgi:hypothetical protein